MDLDAAKTVMQQLYAAVSAPAAEGGAGSFDADTLLDLVEISQQIQNIAAGIQTHAIAHVAAHDEVRDDSAASGWVWKRRSLGTIAEDAHALVATRLGVSAPVAARRVGEAIHQVTVTPQLVDAMGAGDLDLFRASIITRELQLCSDEAAHAIADRLCAHFAAGHGWNETAGPLGSRTRRLVKRYAPEVAAGEGERAIKDRSLSRRAVSSAADHWQGIIPVEQSLVMWQAVDNLARELSLATPGLTLEQARVDALAQLVLQQADVTIHLHATHADTTAEADTEADSKAEAEADTDAATGANEGPDAWEARGEGARRGAGERAETAGESAGKESEKASSAGPSAVSEGAGNAGECAGNAAEDSTSADARAVSAAESSRSSAGLAERAVRGLVELGGLGPGTTLIDFNKLPASVRLVDSTPLTCDPDTGALIAGIVPKSLAPCDLSPPPPDSIEDRYRPSEALQRLIRLRDGHCRFPGCQANARICDIDHVIAWPAGPTSASNLMCLCRRHHRVKQRPGWSVRLDPDGVVHWTDPGGIATDTLPTDHLDRVHLDRVHQPAMPVASNPASPLGRGHRPRPARRPAPGPAARMTRSRLADLVHSSAPAPETLLELALARFLELTNAAPRPSRLTRGDSYPKTPALSGAVTFEYDDPAPAPAPEPDPPPF